MQGRATWQQGVTLTMDVLAATAARAVAGSPCLWAMYMADIGATSTGIDSLRPAASAGMMREALFVTVSYQCLC